MSASELKICMPLIVQVLYVTTGNLQKLKLELLRRTKDNTAYATLFIQCYCLLKGVTHPSQITNLPLQADVSYRGLRINSPVQE